MPYDNTFFEQYAKYLQEPRIRKVHNAMLDDLLPFLRPGMPRILDLGCGIGEYINFYVPSVPHALSYFGVDRESHGPHCGRVADYTNPLTDLPLDPNCFISLFSTECCLDAASKYDLYNDLFNSIPSLRCGLVSGFCYRNRAGLEKVEEVGGIVSYQTIEEPLRFSSSVFSEWRNEVAAPSKMFGDDVVEVWKLLVRKERRMRSKTEEEKLREQIPLSDSQLAAWLVEHNVPFTRDGVGSPWLSNATLKHVIEHLNSNSGGS